MKAYQSKWFEKLNRCKTADDKIVIKVCKEMVADDTGDTDQLAQILAKLILVGKL